MIEKPNPPPLLTLRRTSVGRWLTTIRGGFVPNKILAHPDGGVRTLDVHQPSVREMLEHIERIRLGNRRGGLAYTEISNPQPTPPRLVK